MISTLIESMSPEHRSRLILDFDSEERQRWHYAPRPRSGIARGEMSATQLAAGDSLMADSLSETGYKKAQAIIRHEVILGRVEAREGAMRFTRDPGLYSYTLFGSAGGEEPWGWQLDGHHLCLNYTIIGGDIVSATPSFFGANPAEVKSGPEKGLRILAEEEDLGRGLLLSLETDQRLRAVIYPTAPADIITRASPQVDLGEPEGLPAQLMSADQRQKLMALIGAYFGKMPPDVAADSMAKIEAKGIENIFFAWAGSEHRDQGHYYRIQGPSFFVEYDNTQDMANHIHSVWRDADNDYGFDVLRAHYERHHS